MNTEKPLTNIIWAIDSLKINLERDIRVGHYLIQWAERNKGQVIPVTIFPNKIKNSDNIRITIEDDLDFLHEIISHELVQKPIIHEFDSDKISVQKMAQDLMNFGTEKNADIYVLNKTNNDEFSDFLIGRFSETFLHLTKRPTLLLDQQFNDVKKILFATDFSKDSFTAFKSVAKVAKRMKAKIILYHQFEWLTYHLNAYDISNFHNSKTVQPWEKYCQALNVNFDIKFGENIISPAQSILAAIQELDIDVISLVSKTGRLGTYLLGSTTRHVMRHTNTPLLIMHPEINKP